ncbi:MAG TPA: hypothetical protein VGJ80_15540, partial [Gemmatimonadales bacterium]
MTRPALAPGVLVALIVLAACGDNGNGLRPRVVVAPVLDSLFVGDTVGPFTVTYFDATGVAQPPG